MEKEERISIIRKITEEGRVDNQSKIAVMFDSEDEYVRFVREVYKRYEGEGLEFANVPIILSARIKLWLLEKTWDEFNYRSVTQADLDKVKEELKGWRPWDPEMIKGRHVPGFKGGDENG